MEKMKAFNVGDKVFAKVKGFTAWPAIIIGDQKTKYNVKFYGTGETGIVETKKLFHYLKYKNIFVKSHNNYNKALEEIEAAIKGCGGSDGNTEENEPVDLSISCNTSVNDNSDSSKTTKRKRSASSDELNDSHVKKRSATTPTKTESAPNSVEDSDSEPVLVLPPIAPPLLVPSVSSHLPSTVSESSNEPTHVTIPVTRFRNSIINTGRLRDATNEKEEIKSVTAVNNQTLLELPIETEEERSKYHENVAASDKIEDISERIQNISLLSPADVKIVTDDYLRALIAYAEHTKKNEEIYKNKHVESRNQFENEVVMAKLPSGKFIGIKYNRDHPPSVENEYKRAEYDETEAKRVLSLKNLLQEGKCNPEEDPNIFETNLNIDESHIDQIVRGELIQRKWAKVKFLRIQSSMFKLTEEINGCLGLDKAESKILEPLNLMLQLEINPIMLKKQPDVVGIVKRLRRYTGDLKAWKLTEEEYEKFLDDAEDVRDKAEELYTKFSQLFDISRESTFWDFFTKEVEEFKQQVKDMQEIQVFALSAEPNSRQAFLDSIDEEEEMTIASQLIKNNKPEEGNLSETTSCESDTEENSISTKWEKKNKHKEGNSSGTASSESDTEENSTSTKWKENNKHEEGNSSETASSESDTEENSTSTKWKENNKHEEGNSSGTASSESDTEENSTSTKWKENNKHEEGNSSGTASSESDTEENSTSTKWKENNKHEEGNLSGTTSSEGDAEENSASTKWKKNNKHEEGNLSETTSSESDTEENSTSTKWKENNKHEEEFTVNLSETTSSEGDTEENSTSTSKNKICI